MDERGNPRALPLDHRHGPLGIRLGERDGPAFGIDEGLLIGKPVRHVQRGVTERAGELAPKGPRPGLAQLDDQIGDGRPLP